MRPSPYSFADGSRVSGETSHAPFHESLWIELFLRSVDRGGLRTVLQEMQNGLDMGRRQLMSSLLCDQLLDRRLAVVRSPLPYSCFF